MTDLDALEKLARIAIGGDPDAQGKMLEVTFSRESLAAFTEAVRQEERLQCADECEARASDVREANTYRGRVNAAAEFAADQLEFAASLFRKLNAASAQPEQKR